MSSRFDKHSVKFHNQRKFCAFSLGRKEGGGVQMPRTGKRFLENEICLEKTRLRNFNLFFILFSAFSYLTRNKRFYYNLFVTTCWIFLISAMNVVSSAEAQVGSSINFN